MDGATRMQKMRYITFPSIAGTVTVVLILALGNLLGGFLFDAVGGKPFYLIAGGVMFLSVLVFALSFTLKRRETAPVPAE